MAGDNRIIAFGASGVDGAAGEPRDEARVEPRVETSDEVLAWRGDDAAEADPASTTGRPVSAAPLFALAATVGWTGFFLWSQRTIAVTADEIPALVAQWASPVLLLAVLWLLALRTSRRETARFADAAAALNRESSLLETRLSTVNGELSLAREFIAAQSRDLESLGRLAVERLTGTADRLQELIRENGARLDTIDSVGKSALDNMDKLRGQLPVIASSAKDVTNHIGGAGRAAQAQLEELIAGIDRLSEAGRASDRQVIAVRESVNGATAEFARVCEDLDRTAAARFTLLAQQGADFRVRLETDEIAVLAAVRSRAAALAGEIEATRTALDTQEAESLQSLRARLTALRDEGGVVGRALRDAEARAAGAWALRLEAIEVERIGLEHRLAESERSALDAIEDRVRRLGTEAGELQSRLTRDEQSAIAGIAAQLDALDGAIGARLAEHEQHTGELASRAHALAATLDAHGRSMGEVARSGAAFEADLSHSLATLTDRLTAARATLAATDSEVDRLTDASVRLLELIQASAKHTSGVLPEALAIAEDRLARSRSSLSGLLADLDSGKQRGEAINETIGASHGALLSLVAALSKAQASVSAGNKTHEAEFERLAEALSDLEATGKRVEARTRDDLGTAVEQLAAAVRDALSALEAEGPVHVQALADRLGVASGQAVETAMRPRVAEAAGALEQAMAHASGAGREAASQLREQIAAVDELAGRLEDRVALARSQAHEEVDNDFSRRVALITDALNSHAIDIASALSTDIADTSWAAYLRGDRGIFTRRAVSLLDAGEVRAVQQLFESDDAFRSHVSRYIHDFEAILRQVLSTRDGNALGVTLLSSDMGKLYVALAQGIARLRS